MNNSDFLSEAVALDLGKSGVKVAETLEIQVGDEWWRLINAADVMDVTRYNYRKLADPVLVDGKLELGSFVTKIMPLLPISYSYNTQFPMGIFSPIDGETANIVGSMTFTYNMMYSSLRLGGIFQDLNTSYSGGAAISTRGSYECCSLWDSVNSRFLLSYAENAGVYRAIGVLCTSFEGVPSISHYSQTSPPSASVKLQHLLLDVKCFSPAPAMLYKVYRDSAGELWVDTNSFISGEALSAFRDRLYSASGNATKITIAAGSAGPAGLFYSRWHASVGILWRDTASGICYYALEKEGWDTTHTLPDFLTAAHTITPMTIGTIAVPNSGELLVVGTEKKSQTGVIGRPVGVSFPANLQILGTSYIGNNQSIIIGFVGSTIYRYVVDLTTMSILQITQGSDSSLADVTTIPPQYLVDSSDLVDFKMVYRDASAEYWVGEMYTWSSPWTYLFSVHRWLVSFSSTGEFKWSIDIQNSSTVFPTNLAGSRYSKSTIAWLMQRMGDQLFIMVQYERRGYSPYAYYASVPFADLNNCASASDVSSLLSYKSVSSYFHGSSISPNACLEDDDNYYIYCMYQYNDASRRLFIIDKTTMNIGSIRSISQYDANEFLACNKWDASGLFSHDFSTQGDLLALSSGAREAGTGRMHLVAFKPTLATGAVRTVIINEHTYAYLYRSASTTWSYIPPIGLTNIPLSKSQHALWAVVGLEKDRLGFIGVDATGSYANPGIFDSPALHELAHTHRRFMLNPETGHLWSISNVSSGEIFFAKFHYAGAERDDFAIDVTGDVYKIDFGNVIGGVRNFRSAGDVVTAITGGGSNLIFETGAAPGEGEGTAPSGGEEGAILYTYVSQNFTPYPFAREGIRAELSNISKTTKITLPETRTNLIRGLLASGTDFRGSRCILRRIFPDHADTEGSDIVLLDGYIQDWSYVPGKKGIAFTVSKTLIDVGAQFPKRLMNMGCSHVFKGARCKYLGETGRCLKTKAFCQFLNNQNQFGGFPWVAARQRRVMWR